MRTMLRMCGCAAGFSVLLPIAARAQKCDLVAPATVVASNIGLSTQTAIITNGELSCPGGKFIAAIEISAIEATGTYTLNRNVRYRDADKIVTAEFGQYFKRTSLLQARGNVVVTDIKTGSQLFSPQLDYYQVSPTQKVARMVTLGGRAHVVMKPKPAPNANPTAKKDSSMVDADVVEVIGERTFRGTGTAVITRSDMHGYGNFVEYDQDRGDLLLAQNARLQGDKFLLQGDTIRAVAAEGQQIKDVRSIYNSILTSDEVRVESPFLHIYLDSGSVNRLVATRPPARAGQPVSLPRILSKSFNVSADSIDALAPKQILEKVDAVGHAYGERIDTVPPPLAAKEMPNVLTHDWLRGDTLHATFAPNPDAKQDSAGRNDRVLQRIVARGKYASSAIRMKQPTADEWKIYYTLADRITVDFLNGAVSKVNLDGNVHGVFLSPVGAVPPVKKKVGGP